MHRFPAFNPHFDKIAFLASETKEAEDALNKLSARYGNAPPDKADAIVALGGDGLMLQTMHAHLNSRIPIYEQNIVDITGVVFAKDLMRALRDGRGDMPVREFARPARYVPETKRVADVSTAPWVANTVTEKDILDEPSFRNFCS